MDVVSVCPLPIASVVWQPRRGTWAQTVVAKATILLAPVESTLAHDQERPNDDENHWSDDRARSLYAPSDLVPFKPRADVVLVGHAYAPRKEPARSVVARLVVGEVDKAIEAFCDRTWAPDRTLREGARVAKMPLRWERASGGPETWNPVGMRLDARPDMYGNVPAPNLQPVGRMLSDPKDFVEPVGFGPIAASWPSRREKLGRHAASWSTAAWADQPLPEDIDPSFFNAAPRDQQLDAIRPNERVILENLHPEHARLSTNLPGLAPRAFVERRGAGAQEITMTCDTLWIETDRGICTLTWRGQLPPAPPSSPVSSASPQPPPSRAGVRAPREILDLLWFDPALPPRVRASATWKKLLDDLRPPPAPKKKDDLGFDDDHDDPADAPRPRPPRPRIAATCRACSRAATPSTPRASTRRSPSPSPTTAPSTRRSC
jgi:hypothetical protein